MNLRGLATFRRIAVSSSLAFLVVLALHPDPMVAQSAGKSGRKIVERVEPDYPDFFRNGHFETRIVASATVQPNGNVSNVEIKAGNPMFATFVSKALMKWKYAPAQAQTVEPVIFNFRTNPR